MNRVGTIIAKCDNICTIEFERLESCKACGQCTHSCKSSTIDLKGDFNIGDNVEVCMPDNKFLIAAAIAYLLPLTLLLTGLLLSSILTDNEIIVAFSAFIGLGIGLILLNIVEHTIKNKALWQPYIVGIASHRHNNVDDKLEKINFK